MESRNASSTADAPQGRCKVWLRPLGTACRIRVDKAEQAEWLRGQLQAHGIQCDAPSQAENSCLLYVTYTPHTSQRRLEDTIESTPGVLLQTDPA